MRVQADVLVTDDTDDVVSQASDRLVHVDGELEPSNVERLGEGGSAMELGLEPTNQEMLDYLLEARGDDWLRECYERQQRVAPIVPVVVNAAAQEGPVVVVEQRENQDLAADDADVQALGAVDEDVAEETSSADDAAESTSQVSSLADAWRRVSD